LGLEPIVPKPYPVKHYCFETPKGETFARNTCPKPTERRNSFLLAYLKASIYSVIFLGLELQLASSSDLYDYLINLQSLNQEISRLSCNLMVHYHHICKSPILRLFTAARSLFIFRPILKLYSHYRMHTHFPKSESFLKILSARKMTWSKFHTKDLPLFGATVQNLVIQVT